MTWNKFIGILVKDDRHALETEYLLSGGQAFNSLIVSSKSSKRLIFHAAVKYQAVNCLEYLIGRCANYENLNEPNGIGRSPMHLTAEDPKFLLPLPCLRHLRFRSESTIHINKMNLVIKCLLENGAFPNQRDSDGQTTLHLLAIKSIDQSPWMNQISLEAADQLLQNKTTDIDAINKLALTPLNLIQKYVSDRDDSVSQFSKLLIRNGANCPNTIKYRINQRGGDKTKKYSKRQDRDMLSKLLQLLMKKDETRIKNFFKFNTKTIKQFRKIYIGSQYLIFYLIREFNHELVKMFLCCGGDPWIFQGDNDLPVNAALRKKDHKMMDCIIESMKKYTVSETIHLDSIKMADIYQGKAARINTVELNQHTCLTRLLQRDVILDHISSTELIEQAIKAGDLEAIHLLVKKGKFL